MARWVVTKDADVLLETDEGTVLFVASAGDVVTQDLYRADPEDQYLPIYPVGFIRRSCLQLMTFDDADDIAPASGDISRPLARGPAPPGFDVSEPTKTDQVSQATAADSSHDNSGRTSPLLSARVESPIRVVTPAERRANQPNPPDNPPMQIRQNAQPKGGKKKAPRQHCKGFAKGLFLDSHGCSHVVYCDPKGSPKGILSELKGKGKRGISKSASSNSTWLFVGVMKSFDRDKNGGFVECSETRELYNCDVYIHGSVVPFCDSGKGCQVSFEPFGFRVHLNRNGRPQVRFDSVVALHKVLSYPMVCTIVSVTPEVDYEVSNMAFDKLFDSAVYGDCRDIHDAVQVGSVVSIGVEWIRGWPCVERNTFLLLQ